GIKMPPDSSFASLSEDSSSFGNNSDSLDNSDESEDQEGSVKKLRSTSRSNQISPPAAGKIADRISGASEENDLSSNMRKRRRTKRLRPNWGLRKRNHSTR